MPLVTRFDTPASLRDLPAGSAFYNNWHSPFGLLAYLLSRGQPARAEEPQAAMANWRCALREAVFSVVVYVGAWFLGLMCLAFFLHNPGLWHIPAVTYAALLIVGLLVFRTPLVTSRLGGRYWVALRRIAVTEIISVNFVVAGMAPMLFFVDHEVFSGFTPVFDPRFLLLTTGLASYGVFALYPFNAWMVHHRFDSLVVQLSAWVRTRPTKWWRKFTMSRKASIATLN